MIKGQKIRRYLRTNNITNDMIPLYFRIESLLRNKILSGQLEAGQRLSTEEELIKQFGVSRATIRNALSHLESQGLIVKLRSKGTFVAANVPFYKQLVYTGGVRDIVIDAKKYKTIPIKIDKVRIAETRSPRTVREFFRLTNDDHIARVQRVRKLDGISMHFLESYMTEKISEYLTLEELAQNTILDILDQKMTLNIAQAELYFEAMPAEPDIAQMLSCGIFDPVVCVQILYWLPSGVPFEMANCFTRGDYFKYKVELDATNWRT